MATIASMTGQGEQAARTRKLVFSTIAFLALVALTLIWLLPVFASLITSFRDMDDIAINGFWSIPDELSTDKFSAAWERAGMRQYLLNSFIITIPSLIGMLFLASLSAFALARFKFRGNLFIYFM